MIFVDFLADIFHINRKVKAIELLDKREVIEDNITVERMSKGVEYQYRYFNDPEFAARELRKRLQK